MNTKHFPHLFSPERRVIRRGKDPFESLAGWSALFRLVCDVEQTPSARVPQKSQSVAESAFRVL